MKFIDNLHQPYNLDDKNKDMKTVMIAILLVACPPVAMAAEAVPFAEAKPKRDIDSRVAIHFKIGEKLYIKLPKGFLIISVDNLKSQNNDAGISESCIFTITHIENDRITVDSKTSAVVYSAEMKDDGKHLTVVDGTQDFRKAGIEFSWSVASKDSIYFYVPPKIKYAIIGTQE